MKSMGNTKKTFIDTKIDVKIKIAALWTAIMFLYIYNDFFTLFKPGSIEEMQQGIMGILEVNQNVLLGTSLLMAIPAVMIFISLILKPKLNRIVNIIFGLLYIAVMVASVQGEWLYYIFMGVVEIILTALIVLYAFKWPKLEV